MSIAYFKKRRHLSNQFEHGQRFASVLVICCLNGATCLAAETHHAKKDVGYVFHPIKVNTAPAKLQNTLWWQVAKSHQLDPYVLYAVALIESAKNKDPDHITPWPWAINKSGQSFIPASKQAANVLLHQSIAKGGRHIDVGMMQINLRWHGHRVTKPEHLLDPVINLTIAAQILAEAIQSSPNNLVLGIGRYHSWQNNQASIAYGQRVLSVADQIRTVL